MKPRDSKGNRGAFNRSGRPESNRRHPAWDCPFGHLTSCHLLSDFISCGHREDPRISRSVTSSHAIRGASWASGTERCVTRDCQGAYRAALGNHPGNANHLDRLGPAGAPGDGVPISNGIRAPLDARPSRAPTMPEKDGAPAAGRDKGQPPQIARPPNAGQTASSVGHDHLGLAPPCPHRLARSARYFRSRK